MQIPDMYSLERLSDEEFWDLAFAKASSPLQGNSSLLDPSPHITSTQQMQQAQRMSDKVYVVCDDTYAFPLTALNEIVPISKPMTLLPNTPSWMMGLIAWQGHILSTIDLHAYLTGNSPTSQERSLLIAHHDDRLLAFATQVGQSTSLLDNSYTILNVTLLFDDIVQCLEKQASNE